LNAHGFRYLIKAYLVYIINSGLKLYYFDEKFGIPKTAAIYYE
jgi:hypothetical protein